MPAHRWPAPSRREPLDLDWMRDGACLTRVDLPWTGDSHQLRRADRLTMAAVCAGCPVLASCDRFAAQAHVTAGFWAGRARDDTKRTVEQPHTLGGVA